MARSKKGNRNRRERARSAQLARLTPAQRLANAQEVLDATRHAAEDFENAETLSRAKTAVRNFVEQGRSVTWALRHLKNEVEDPAEWNQWWNAATAALREDPAAQWFYNLRNPIVKEGRPVDIQHVARVQGQIIVPPPDEERPPGATGYALHGLTTASWVMKDGSHVPARPLQWAELERWHTLAGAPEELSARPLVELMRGYIAVLDGIVLAAHARFGDE